MSTPMIYTMTALQGRCEKQIEALRYYDEDAAERFGDALEGCLQRKDMAGLLDLHEEANFALVQERRWAGGWGYN